MSIIKIRSGKYIDLANPKVEDIDFDSLVHGISEEGRYSNQCQYRRCSVAEHSVLVSYLVKNYRASLLALVHDLTEGILRDLPSPLKKLIPDYAEIEDNLAEVIFKALNIKKTNDLWKTVKIADGEAYHLEKFIFFTDEDKKQRKEAFKVVRSLGWNPGLSAPQAKKLFLNRWNELIKRGG